MTNTRNRRDFIRHLGLGAASLPFVANLPSLAATAATDSPVRKQRLIIMFSPNGIVPNHFWPDREGKDFELKEILSPLTPYKDRTLVLHGVCDKVRGDGDNHMRGMGCLLTGSELFPGNIQGGSHTPAGWASGLSIDQEIKNHLQANPATRTRFGSLEFGVLVPERADTWTRMVYGGPNQPIAPIDDPYQMFKKLYGSQEDQRHLSSILDDVQEDLQKVRSVVSAADRQLLDEHTAFVRQMEQDLKSTDTANVGHAMPKLEPGIKEQDSNLPKIAKMQMELLVNSLANDFTRIGTFQFTNSVGQARMSWLDISEGHHELSHKPDSDKEAQTKLTKINKWFCEQMAYLVKRLDETPDPHAGGSLLDSTTVIWTNELGKGNSHTLDNIPFVMVGGGLGFNMGQSLKFPRVPHHRLLLSLAHAFGHELKEFGNPNYCGDGPLELS